MSVIVGRALPDVRDGMKPVHRRVLFAMDSLSNYHNKPFLKSARVVGDANKLPSMHPDLPRSESFKDGGVLAKGFVLFIFAMVSHGI